MAIVTVFVDDAAVTARSAEVPDATWNDGCNGGSNSCGIGIGAETNLAESGQWTLLDQFGNARNGQRSQYIGGSGLGAGTAGTLPASTIRCQDNETMGGMGTLSFPAPNAILTDLAAGWTLQAPARAATAGPLSAGASLKPDTAVPDWDAHTVYAKGDMVAWNAEAWRALKKSEGVEPSGRATATWEKLTDFTHGHFTSGGA